MRNKKTSENTLDKLLTDFSGFNSFTDFLPRLQIAFKKLGLTGWRFRT